MTFDLHFIHTITHYKNEFTLVVVCVVLIVLVILALLYFNIYRNFFFVYISGYVQSSQTALVMAKRLR